MMARPDLATIRPPALDVENARRAAMAHLAQRLDVSVDRVRAAIEHLEARGLIKFEARTR